MTLTSTIITLLFIGSAQGFLLSIALVSIQRGNRKANRILALLLFLFSVMIVFHASGQTQGGSSSAAEEPVGHIVVFLFGPLLLWYGRALTNPLFLFRRSDIFHMVPFLTAILLVFGIEPLIAEEYLVVPRSLLLLFILFQLAYYLIRVLLILRGYRARLQETYSSLERINLRWLQFIAIGQMIIWPVALVIELTKTEPSAMNLVWLLISVFMYCIGYFGIRQPEVFTGLVEQQPATPALPPKKYERSTLSQERVTEIFLQLLELMEKEKPYRENLLTLPVLAERLSVPMHHVSRVINERAGQNFFEFINSYRVEAAKQLLADKRSQHLTLAAIGFEAGFNSVSSFNSIFKKYTAKTPSQYRNNAVPQP